MLPAKLGDDSHTKSVSIEDIGGICCTPQPSLDHSQIHLSEHIKHST